MGTQSKARLYAVTALVCFIWLVQAVYQAVGRGQLLSWPNLVFYVCMLLIIGYTGYCAVHDWSGDGEDDGASENEGEGAETGGAGENQGEEAETAEKECVVGPKPSDLT